MKTIREKVLNEIKFNRGINLTELYTTLDKEKQEGIDNALDKLINEGVITNYRGENYPIVRHINVYSKKNEKFIEEVELPGLAASELNTFMQPYQDDPLYFDGYELSEGNTSYFINRYGIRFEFDKYNYYLEASFDNRKQE